MKTKLILAALAAASCLGFAGCNLGPASNAPSSTQTTSSTASTPDITPILEGLSGDAANTLATVEPALNSLATMAPGAVIETGTLASQIANTLSAFGAGNDATAAQNIANKIASIEPAVITGAQAVEMLVAMGAQAAAVTQEAFSSPATSGTAQ
jgi:hypothetical protein